MMSVRARSMTWFATGVVLALVAVLLVVVSQQLAGAVKSTGERPVFVPITPCRLLDTRSGPDNVGPRSTPIGQEETYDVVGRSPSGDCTGTIIPGDATGLALNVTAVGATRQTNLRIFPQGAPLPTVSNLNPSPGAAPTPNAVVTDLAPNGQFSIYNFRGEVDVVVDAAGYFVDHDHDDRYLLEGPIEIVHSLSDVVPDPGDAPTTVALDVGNEGIAVEVSANGTVYVGLEGPRIVGVEGFRLASVEYCVSELGLGRLANEAVLGNPGGVLVEESNATTTDGCYELTVPSTPAQSFVLSLTFDTMAIIIPEVEIDRITSTWTPI